MQGGALLGLGTPCFRPESSLTAPRLSFVVVYLKAAFFHPSVRDGNRKDVEHPQVLRSGCHLGEDGGIFSTSTSESHSLGTTQIRDHKAAMGWEK